MNRERYARPTLLVSLILSVVYVVNLLYLRAISDGSLGAIGDFAGLTGVQQVVLLLAMSAFFAASITLRADS